MTHQESTLRHSLRALRLVGIDLVAKVVLIGISDCEAELVFVAALSTTCKVMIVLVCGLWNANHREESVC